MHTFAPGRRIGGFTLVEALVVIAIGTVLLSLGVPRFYEYIVLTRLKSVNSQLVTDLQYARQEAMTRGVPVFITGGVNPSMSCYTIYSNSNASHGSDCLCQLAAGSRCTVSGLTELKTVQLPVGDKVLNIVPERFAFDPVTGGILYGNSDYSPTRGVSQSIRTQRTDAATQRLVTQVSPSGRPSVCALSGNIKGYPSC